MSSFKTRIYTQQALMLAAASALLILSTHGKMRSRTDWFTDTLAF